MQQVYANTSKVMVDAKGQGNLLYLPLDKLMQSAGSIYPSIGTSAETASAPARSAGAGEVLPQPSDKVETRSREALRSRDRETR